MQTQIAYNGVLIKDVLSEPISHTPAKDSTGVDQIGVRTVIDCTGVVHTSAQDHTGKKVTGPLATSLADLLAKLSKDRRPFRMQIGTAVLYDIKPGAAEPGVPAGTVTSDLHKMDIDQGPRPSVEVLKIVSGHSAIIRFRVEFVKVNCGGVAGRNDLSQSGIVNFRFWIADDTDCKTWLSTRTYSGSLRVAHKNISPHTLARQIVVPPLQPGFAREIVQLHESPDGLSLEFTVQDREFIVAPPWSPTTKTGATDWHGTFQVSTSDFATNYSELNFQLTGPKGTTKRDLMLIGLKLVSKKTHYLGLSASSSTAGQAYLQQFAIKEELSANTVEFAVRLRHNGKPEQLIGIFSVGGKLEIGQPLGDLEIGYQSQRAFEPGPSATLSGLFRSLLQTPCNPQQMPKHITGGIYPQSYASAAAAGSGSDPARNALPVVDSQASLAHLAAMYLDYRMTSELIIDGGLIALPTGASSQQSGSRAATRAFVQLYQPTADRVITIDAARLTKPPQLPKPNKAFTDGNGIECQMIGEAHIAAGVPQLSADARKMLFTASMKMRYAMSRAPRESEAIPIGALPYRTSSPGDTSRKLPPEIFIDPKTILA